MKPNNEIAMQQRCVYCGKEQYAMAVCSISHGEHPCVWCGETPPVMTVKEYKLAIKKYYQSKN